MKTVVEYDVGHDVVNLLVQGNRGFEDTSRTGKNTWANPKSKKMEKILSSTQSGEILS